MSITISTPTAVCPLAVESFDGPVFVTDDCRACDYFGLCHARNPGVARASCATCDDVNWCRPRRVDSSVATCASCDYQMVCRSNQGNGGHCLLNEHGSGCPRGL